MTKKTLEQRAWEEFANRLPPLPKSGRRLTVKILEFARAAHEDGYRAAQRDARKAEESE